MRAIAGLLIKDLYLYGRALVEAWAVLSALVLLVTWFSPPNQWRQMLAPLLCGNIVLNLFYTDFLVDREKVKGTVAWLRTMPLSEAHIVTSKLLGLALMTFAGNLASTAALAPRFLVLRPGEFLASVAGMLCLGAMMMVTRWMLGARYGRVVPLLVAFVAPVGFSRLKKTFPGLGRWLTRVWPTAGFKFLLCLTAAAWVVFMGWILVRLLAARDTDRLVE